jgi:hypothetical protein
MAAAEPFFPPFTEEESARLAVIWDQLYSLYLARANAERPEDEIEAEIAELIAQRNEIRSWGWNTGRNWRDDMPPEMKKAKSS